jgi:TetR/AcrR family transcriptional regulator, fatty acid metabolism regulator protein
MKTAESRFVPDLLRDLKASPRPDVPPGGVKIMEALRLLLKEKDFNSITTAEISRASGVNEALIYRYFKDKRGLLHKVLAEFLHEFLVRMASRMEEVETAGDKIDRLIRTSISFYDQYRVFAKILLLEVRNCPGYFDSDAYALVRKYSRMLRLILEEGVGNGEIRSDISPSVARDLILGGIEHVCLPAIVFDRELDVEAVARSLSKTVLDGVLAEKSTDR